MVEITPKTFSYSNSFFSCYSFCCNKMFSVSFLSVSKLYFSLQDFCLTCLTARFLLIFDYLLITCCQTNKQMKSSGTNNSSAAKEWKVFCSGCYSKEFKHYTFPLKIYKSSVKKSRRRLCINCDWPRWAMCCRQG